MASELKGQLAMAQQFTACLVATVGPQPPVGFLLERRRQRRPAAPVQGYPQRRICWWRGRPLPSSAQNTQPAWRRA